MEMNASLFSNDMYGKRMGLSFDSMRGMRVLTSERDREQEREKERERAR